MTEIAAAIDLGTYTARMLIARIAAGAFQPLLRQRVYVRTAEGMDEGGRLIGPAAEGRALEALARFQEIAAAHEVDVVRAVATGVLREAPNRDELLGRILRRTGIRVRVVDGAEEARLSARGAMQALDMSGKAALFFDLGGGSTDFHEQSRGGECRTWSLPIGAAVLTQHYLRSDPPTARELENLAGAVDLTLGKADAAYGRAAEPLPVVGTGGTVTALAAMAHSLKAEEIRPELVNGRMLEVGALETWLARLKTMGREARMQAAGLDPERAAVIVAGLVATLRILHSRRARRMRASMADLLEGLLLGIVKGEKHGP